MILQGHISWSGLTKNSNYSEPTKSLDKKKHKCYTNNIRKKNAKSNEKRNTKKWKKKRLALIVQQNAVNV